MTSLRLLATTCGHLTMDAGFFLAGAPGKVTIPVPCFVIVHPKGTVVFDTGLEERLQSSDEGVVRSALATMADHAQVRFRPGEEFAARIEHADLDPARIDYLVNSHLHLDHCGGNSMLPNARLVVQRREWEAATTPELQNVHHYTRRHYDIGHDRLEVEGEHDLFGDGSIVCIPTHGHTPGHQSLRVRTGDGDVVLTSDACYMRDSLERMRMPIPEVVADPERMLATFRLFQGLRDAGVQLVFGHDPEQWAALNRGPLEELTAASVAAESAARPTASSPRSA